LLAYVHTIPFNAEQPDYSPGLQNEKWNTTQNRIFFGKTRFAGN